MTCLFDMLRMSCGGRRLKLAAVVADRRDVDISAIAHQGLEQAQVQLENAASTLAGAGASPGSSISDSVDLSAGVVDLMSAQINFAVNISALKTADQIQKYVIDLLA